MEHKEKIENLLAEAMDLLLDEMKNLDLEDGDQEYLYYKIKEVADNLKTTYNDITEL